MIRRRPSAAATCRIWYRDTEAMIYSYGERHLETEGDYFVAPSADVIGSVRLGHEASIWFGAVLRGDNDWIRIGAGSNVQDGSIVHVDPGVPVTIGANVTIGHGVLLHGCTIGDGALVGNRAMVLDGAQHRSGQPDRRRRADHAAHADPARIGGVRFARQGHAPGANRAIWNGWSRATRSIAPRRASTPRSSSQRKQLFPADHHCPARDARGGGAACWSSSSSRTPTCPGRPTWRPCRPVNARHAVRTWAAARAHAGARPAWRGHCRSPDPRRCRWPGRTCALRCELTGSACYRHEQERSPARPAAATAPPARSCAAPDSSSAARIGQAQQQSRAGAAGDARRAARIELARVQARAVSSTSRSSAASMMRPSGGVAGESRTRPSGRLATSTMPVLPRWRRSVRGVESVQHRMQCQRGVTDERQFLARAEEAHVQIRIGVRCRQCKRPVAGVVLVSGNALHCRPASSQPASSATMAGLPPPGVSVKAST